MESTKSPSLRVALFIPALLIVGIACGTIAFVGAYSLSNLISLGHGGVSSDGLLGGALLIGGVSGFIAAALSLLFSLIPAQQVRRKFALRLSIGPVALGIAYIALMLTFGLLGVAAYYLFLVTPASIAAYFGIVRLFDLMPKREA